jgi:hypothetical protein
MGIGSWHAERSRFLSLGFIGVNCRLLIREGHVGFSYPYTKKAGELAAFRRRECSEDGNQKVEGVPR